MSDRLLGIEELSDYLGVPVATIYQWRSRGEGPPAMRVGKHLRWKPARVEQWLESRYDGTPAA